jgi:hypothetical protein
MISYHAEEGNLLIDPGDKDCSGMDLMADERKYPADGQKKQCTCEPCPSYTECMRADDELLFCLTGRSRACTFEKKGCLCPSCPVTAARGLKHAYYCVKGAESEQ